MPSSYAITTYFGSTNPYQKIGEAQQMFYEDLVFYICIAYQPISTIENIWLKKLVICQCP